MLRWLLLLGLCQLTLQEMSQALDTDGNTTEQREHANDWIRIDFSHTGAPLVIIANILMIALLKIVLERFKGLPHSVWLIFFGVGMGYLLSLVFADEVYLRPDWFFIYLLPSIVLEAGYFLKKKDFFHNIGTICVYAIIGTILNTGLMAGLLYYFRSYFLMDDVGFLPILVFSTLISAVDPVAVLCVFEDIQVNELLNICVFGESLLNDAVTIVLYHTVTDMMIAGSENTGVADYVSAVGKFGVVSFGGISFGIIGGFMTAGCVRLLVRHQVVQPILILFFPYVVYLITDSFHLSGILAIATTGVVINNYMKGNLVVQMNFVCEYMLKMTCSNSESLIFLFLGVSVISSNHLFDAWFTIITLAGTFILRFIVTFFLTFFINKCRSPGSQISLQDQFIMAYGGLRGAVCYGLVMSIDENLIPEKKIFVTTTLVVIIFTTVIQGSSIKFLVTYLNVKRSKNFGREVGEKKTTVVQMINQSNRFLLNFVENITKEHKDNRIYRKFHEWDEKYLKPLFVYNNQSSAEELKEQQIEYMIDEYAVNIRKDNASFACLPRDVSMQHLKLPTSKSELFSSGFHADQLTVEPKSKATSTAAPKAIPRNESVSVLVTQAFEDREQQTIHRKEQKRPSIYSRHLMTNMPSTPIPEENEMSEDEQQQSYLFTFPYAKNQNNKLASNIKKYSRSLKDPHRNRVTSPTRSMSTRQGGSSGRPTSPPVQPGPSNVPDKLVLPIKFSIVDEENSPSPPQAPKRGKERTVTAAYKTFTIEDEGIQLLPITEEKDKQS